ncbi:2'-5' RNA ligase family protein [Roseomonas sp. CAU 1739]|uniref:2'-5' RNA ligase family protein n=1 Tax=Roseomonas sp. CAU 1739 TaxID=3140364 RepID=UPI00325BC714
MSVTSTCGEADPLYGTGCEAWQLQIGLAAEPGLVAAQALVSAHGDAALHVIPPAFLHVTVLPLIDVAERLSAPPAVLWDRHGATWQRAIADACRATSPFRMHFARLRAFPRAIVALDGINPLAALRARLAGGCALPERPVRLPGITHVTLARFRQAARVSIPEALDVSVEVRQLRLVRETVYPTLAFETVATFAL